MSINLFKTTQKSYEEKFESLLKKMENGQNHPYGFEIQTIQSIDVYTSSLELLVPLGSEFMFTLFKKFTGIPKSTAPEMKSYRVV